MLLGRELLPKIPPYLMMMNDLAVLLVIGVTKQVTWIGELVDLHFYEMKDERGNHLHHISRAMMSPSFLRPLADVDEQCDHEVDVNQLDEVGDE